jgi:hypothetical protein
MGIAMTKWVEKKTLVCAIGLAVALPINAVAADWELTQPRGYYNQGYGDFPPSDISQRQFENLPRDERISGNEQNNAQSASSQQNTQQLATNTAEPAAQQTTQTAPATQPATQAAPQQQYYYPYGQGQTNQYQYPGYGSYGYPGYGNYYGYRPYRKKNKGFSFSGSPFDWDDDGPFDWGSNSWDKPWGGSRSWDRGRPRPRPYDRGRSWDRDNSGFNFGNRRDNDGFNWSW